MKKEKKEEKKEEEARERLKLKTQLLKFIRPINK